MFDDTEQRKIRAFHLYKGKTLNVVIEDRPGVYHSGMPPGPNEGLPQHPFNTQLFNSLPAQDLLEALGSAEDFDSFVTQMVKAGYDVFAGNDFPEFELPGLHRLTDGKGNVAGAVWQQPGQFTCLWWQPAGDELVFKQAAVTVYRQEWAETLFNIVKSTKTFEELNSGLEKAGLKLSEVIG